MNHVRNHRTRITTLLVAFTIVLTAAFAAGTETAEAAVKLNVSPSSKTIYIGNKVTLKANKKVKWSIVNKKSNIKIVSKTSRKVTVKGVKAGTVYVKAKAGKKYKKVKIVVRSRVPKTISLVSTKDIIGVDDHCMVYVQSVSPSYASSDVSFSSSDNEIATVDNTGYVTAVSEGTVTITARSKLSSSSKGSIKLRIVNTLNGVVTTKVDMTDETRYPAGKEASVWIPVPQSEDGQLVPESIMQWRADSASKAEITTDSAGNKTLYIMWGEDVSPEKRTAIVKYHMTRQEIIRDDALERREHGAIDTNAMSAFLKETGTTGKFKSGVVRTIADNAVARAEAKTVYQKARAIYNWACDNLKFDDSAAFVGADAAELILEHREERRYGSYDISNTFVAMLRAEGIPARTVTGIKPDSVKDITDGAMVQYCRSQFYMPGYGWVDVDICAALSVISGNEDLYLGKDAPYASKWVKLKDDKFGTCGENWVKVSTGEDIELSPRQGGSSEDSVLMNEDGTLKHLAYPYAEYDGKPVRSCNLSSSEKSELTYRYYFEKDSKDCGCD